MKRLPFVILLVSAFYFYSCKKDDVKTTPTPEPIIQTIELKGEITKDSTLQIGSRYLLIGKVYVKNNSVLSIPAGVIIEVEKREAPGDKSALIITKGSKLNISGTSEKPVIFTSAATEKSPGDWLGIVILGKAPTNQKNAFAKGLPKISDHEFGGIESADNSGSISYLRLEYPGGLNPAQEEEWEWDMVSGLSFNGVGNATKVNHVMVSHSRDDGFQFVGGTLNAQYLISANNGDDNFDFDRGYTGNLQFLISYNKEYSTFAIRGNGVESLNDKDATSATPYTRPVISNITIVGPEKLYAVNQSQGIYIRKNTRFAIINSIISGYSGGALMMCSKTKPILLNNEGSLFINNLTNAHLLVNNFMYDNGPTGTDIAPDKQVKAYAIEKGAAIEKPSVNRNSIIENIEDLKFSSIYTANPDFSLKNGSEALSNAEFTLPDYSTFFTKVNFRGAVGTENWAKGTWVKW